jgi:hypothetical protein
MMIGEVTILWTGLTGLPGTTTLNFFTGAASPIEAKHMTDAADAFASTLITVLGNGTSLQVQPEVKFLDEASGVLDSLAAVSPPPPAHVASASGQVGPLPSGAVIAWATDGVHLRPGALKSRRVRGRTFVVPLALAAYQSDGTITGTIITALSGAASTLVGDASTSFVIWARPVDGAGGASFPVTTWHITDQAAVLRSRRD